MEQNKSSITALMSSFGRAFHAENEEHPVFRDSLAKELLTEEEYNAVQGYILSGAKFFEPELDMGHLSSKEIVRLLVNKHLAPSPLCRAAYTENLLKNMRNTTRSMKWITLLRRTTNRHALRRQDGTLQKILPLSLSISQRTAFRKGCLQAVLIKTTKHCFHGWA